MKTLRSILTASVAIAVLSLVACSSNNEGDATPVAEKAEINISLSSDKIEGRAPGVTVKADEKINHYVAFAFLSNGKLDDFAVSQSAGNSLMDNVTTGTKSVYVVANVPLENLVTVDAGASNGYTSKITTLTQLKNHLESMVDGQTILLKNDNVWASGYNDNITFTKEANVNKAAVTVKVFYAAAKVHLTLTNNMTNKEADGAYKVTDVIAINVVSKSKLFSASAYDPSVGHTVSGKVTLMPSGNDLGYLSGVEVDDFSKADKTNTTVIAGLKDDATTETKFHYYLPENDASKFTTIIAVVIENGAGKLRYFPVHFKADDNAADKGSVYAGYNVIRNNFYNIALTITGDASDNPGTPDPTDTTAELSLTVDLQGWNPVIDINKEL